jgi:hypothetical protein
MAVGQGFTEQVKYVIARRNDVAISSPLHDRLACDEIAALRSQ